LPEEISACRQYLAAEIAAMPKLRAILALGQIAHGAVLSALGHRKSAFAFKHGALHALPDGKLFADSYHCSRYNTNTGKLTTAMFEAVFKELRKTLEL
jgi:uracil-DNA glycosylase